MEGNVVVFDFSRIVRVIKNELVNERISLAPVERAPRGF